MFSSLSARVNRSTTWVWMSAGMLSLCLLALLTVVLLLGWNGLGYFWPLPVYQFELATDNQWAEAQKAENLSAVNPPAKKTLFAQIYAAQPMRQAAQLNPEQTPAESTYHEPERLLLKTANRDSQGHDFISVFSPQVLSRAIPTEVAVIERTQHGQVFAVPLRYERFGQPLTGELTAEWFEQMIAQISQQQREVSRLKEDIEQNYVALLQADASLERYFSEQQSPPLDLLQQTATLRERYQLLDARLLAEQNQLMAEQLIARTADGQLLVIPAQDILQIWFPNQLSLVEKAQHWLGAIVDFIRLEPRKSAAESGIFPAIFGTILMVLTMSVVVMPLGVLAAVYLHEYAKKNTVTRLIRLAVVNLAGVPSIVYGVFGLGFFVYMLGGNIDALFYSDNLPSPTFGTPGLLWSSFTLALLTLPVVIVSTEEGLMRIPSSVRDASFALGATQAETLRRIVLPMATPAMMTGLILAIARAAGEVAPLMLVGVVKLAPSLPLDMTFPYLHLDRKFMHLGYHIYDLGMQHTHLEAVRPLVYATTLLLVLVVLGLNITAVVFRHHLREKYRLLEPSV